MDPKKDEAKKQDDDESEEEEEEILPEVANNNLLAACREDDVEKAEEWLNKKADANYTSEDGWNSVLWAACNGNDKLIRILHNHGAT